MVVSEARHGGPAGVGGGGHMEGGTVGRSVGRGAEYFKGETMSLACMSHY